jgi:2-polyprenyl-3-methyl-5-hydroxy-6-metoxy-1,4-benzoquinol methylase
MGENPMELYKISSNYSLVAKRMVRMWKRWLSAILPYQPMNGAKKILDTEYSSGLWDYLRGVNELVRFSVVVGYCHYFKKGGAILEIGCGEGILQERLCPSKYTRYVGVDISSEAIKRATHRQDEKTFFVREDASLYTPNERFDVIIFNECLEYFDNPLSLVQRYETFLEPDGVYIVSMFVGIDTVRTKRIWKMLEAVYTVETKTQVTTMPGYSWIIKVFKPARSKNEASGLQ